jgi:hypothetical protein
MGSRKWPQAAASLSQILSPVALSPFYHFIICSVNGKRRITARVEASAFYRSMTQKRKPKFSTVRSTVEQDFDANPRNSAQRNAKAK